MADTTSLELECDMFRRQRIVFLFRASHDLAKQIDAADRVRAERPVITGSFLDTGFGERKALHAAVEHAKSRDATLLFLEHRDATSDRELVSTLVESNVVYHFNNAHTRLKREIDDSYINRPLREAKAKLGVEADASVRVAAPIIAEIVFNGITGRNAIAAELTRRGVPTPRGGTWHATTVGNVMRRIRAL